MTSLQVAAASSLVIRGGSVFDPKTGSFQENQNVYVEGTKIRAVHADSADAKIPASSRVIDARGKFIIPGLIDAHVHLSETLLEAQVTGDEILPLYLRYGVTSIRDTGDNPSVQKILARMTMKDPRSGPTIFMSSPLLDGSPPIHPDSSRIVTNKAQVEEAIRDASAWGATTVKIYYLIQRPIGQMIIQDAHKAGLLVTAHLGLYSAQDAVSDGIDGLEHIISIFDWGVEPGTPDNLELKSKARLDSPRFRQLIQMLVDKHVYVDPNLVVYKNMLVLPDLDEVRHHPDLNIVPPRLLQSWKKTIAARGLDASSIGFRRELFQKYETLTGLLNAAGVKLLVGTDSSAPFVPAGASMHQELELLVQSGLTPAQALTAATLNNASVLGTNPSRGQISAGNSADLVILKGNPLENIRNTRSIEVTLHAGQLIYPP